MHLTGTPGALVRVLYVEDDVVNRLVMQRLLWPYHIEVDLAAGAEEARRLVRAHRYPLILMDINLGDEEVDGIALARQLIALQGPCPVFAITAYPEAEREAGEQQPFDRYFIKPFDREALAQAILDTVGPN